MYTEKAKQNHFRDLPLRGGKWDFLGEEIPPLLIEIFKFRGGGNTDFKIDYVVLLRRLETRKKPAYFVLVAYFISGWRRILYLLTHVQCKESLPFCRGNYFQWKKRLVLNRSPRTL